MKDQSNLGDFIRKKLNESAFSETEWAKPSASVRNNILESSSLRIGHLSSTLLKALLIFGVISLIFGMYYLYTINQNLSDRNEKQGVVIDRLKHENDEILRNSEILENKYAILSDKKSIRALEFQELEEDLAALTVENDLAYSSIQEYQNLLVKADLKLLSLSKKIDAQKENLQVKSEQNRIRIEYNFDKIETVNIAKFSLHVDPIFVGEFNLARGKIQKNAKAHQGVLEFGGYIRIDQLNTKTETHIDNKRFEGEKHEENLKIYSLGVDVAYSLSKHWMIYSGISGGYGKSVGDFDYELYYDKSKEGFDGEDKIYLFDVEKRSLLFDASSNEKLVIPGDLNIQDRSQLIYKGGSFKELSTFEIPLSLGYRRNLFGLEAEILAGIQYNLYRQTTYLIGETVYYEDRQIILKEADDNARTENQINRQFISSHIGFGLAYPISEQAKIALNTYVNFANNKEPFKGPDKLSTALKFGIKYSIN